MASVLSNDSLKKYNWSPVFLWGIVPAIVFMASMNTGEKYIDKYDEIIFWTSSILIMFWGIFSGLVSKNDAFYYKYAIIKNVFLILFLSIVSLAFAISFWIVSVDNLKMDLYIDRVFIVGVICSAIFVLPSFFCGYIIAKIVSYSQIFLSDQKVQTR